MQSIWKPIGILSLSAVAVLAGLLLWVSFREHPMTARMRSNIEDQIRYHLGQNEPQKAAAILDSSDGSVLDPGVENVLRLETAKKSAPEAGAKILDGLKLAAMDREQAAQAAQTRLDLQRQLFTWNVLQNGALPAPYELPALLKSTPSNEAPREMSRITAKLLSLISERRDLAKRHGAAVDPALAPLESMAVAVRYALGEVPFEELRVDDPEIRFQVGDLLYRERQFDRALDTWRPLAADKRVIRRIAELAALRRYAPKYLRIWDHDVEKLLGRDAKLEAEVAQEVESRFKESIPGGEILLRPRDVFERKGIPADNLDATVSDEPAIFFPEAPTPPPTKADIVPNLNQLYVLAEHHLFEFQTTFDRPFLTRADPQFRLHSGYTGPLRFRLFKVRDLRTLTELNAETLTARRSELQPVREWQKQFSPLGPNGGNAADWLVEVPSSGTGLFVLMADARYCPVYAFARYIVTDTGLLQQPALDRVLIHSVDRITGAPVADLPLEGEVRGQYVLDARVTLPPDDANADEYKRGFSAAWAGKAAEDEAVPSYAQGYQSALRLRAEHPDVSLIFKGTTDKDGLFDWTVTPAWKEGYSYKIRTTSLHGETCTRVESTYAPSDKTSALIALVYSDRPVYRAGDTVSFKALLRRRDGEGLQPYDGKEALIEIGSADRTIYVRSLPVSDFGSASGTLELHDEFSRADYWVRVNNSAQMPLFKMEDFRKPEFEIVISAPTKVRAGQAVDIPVQVRRYSGEPLVRTQVVLRIQRAPALSAARLLDETGWESGRSNPAWRPIEERYLETDVEGRCLFRFQTEAKLPARYSATAHVAEESGRQASASASFEAAAAIREVAVETDRPVYYPGETAQLRFKIADATTVRVEERAKVEKPFAISVALRDGVGSCEYTIPPLARDLQIGVREGDAWTWTPVALRIRDRAAASELVNLRVNHPLYQVGESAKVEISSSEPDASVLLLSATGKIHRRQVVQLRNRRAEVSLEVRDEDVPNVHLVALTVKNDHVGKATVSLEVPPLQRFLTVEVTTDQREYRPGQECRTTVTVRDAQGRPVPDCELSLGVVDESIYAIKPDLTPDLREYFHRYSRPLRVSESFFYKENLPPFMIWKCPVFVRGNLNLYDTLGMGVGGGGGGRYGGRFGGRANMVMAGGGTRAADTRPPRSDFRDTAYWSAHLKTGADGTATATFAFPDNLTRFRFTARGITRAHQVGEVRQETIVRKPFFVRLATPRVIQEGNSVAVSGMVHNQTDKPQTVRVSLKAPCPILSSTAPTLIPLQPGDSSRVEYLLSNDSPREAVELTFAAESDAGENDSVRIRVPGRRHGTPYVEGRSGSVAGGTPKEEVFRIPSEALPGTLSLRFDFDAGIHTAIVNAVDPLIEYPYGCVEQTMSRFLPAVAARRALGEVPLRFREKLPAVLASGLQRLYHLQAPNGSWGWWHGSNNEALSAYVLYGLAVCKKSGVGVDRAAAERAAKFLTEHVSKTVFQGPPGDESRLPLRVPLDSRVYHLLALAEYHAAWEIPAVTLKQLIGTMADHSEGFSAADETVLALAALRAGMTDVADAMGRRAQRHAPADVATASFLLQLQAARGGDLAPTVRYLLGQRRGRGWASTLESAYAILGLAAAVERPTPAMDLAPGRVEIRVNGEPVQEFTLRGAVDAAFDGRVSIPAPTAGWGEKAVVTLTFDGQGAAFYTASLEALLGGEDRPPVSNGLGIQREYFERDVVDRGGWVPVRGPVAPGRSVLVLLRITSSDPRDYVMITDPRPDGFEPVERPMDSLQGHLTVLGAPSDRIDLEREWPARLEDFRRTARGDAGRESAWTKALLRDILEKKMYVRSTDSRELPLPPAAGPTNIEHRDDRTIFFLTSLPAGTRGVWYFARPEHPGRVHALPPRAEAMYEPELHAIGVEDRLEIADGTLVRRPAPQVESPRGVDGLLDVLPAIGRVDADAIIAKIPSSPRIGELLAAACGEEGFRAWLTAMPATRAAGRGLRERIEAARSDLATRSLAVEQLSATPKPWLPMLEATLKDTSLTDLVLKEADPAGGSSADNILLWIAEDREWRSSLLTEIQRKRGTARIQSANIPRLDFERVLRALGGQAPTGEALLDWKLAQRTTGSGGSLQDGMARLGRDLSLRIRVQGVSNVELGQWTNAPFRLLLEKTLMENRLCYRVQGDEIVVLPLEDLLR